jgi:hypothetical protein
VGNSAPDAARLVTARLAPSKAWTRTSLRDAACRSRNCGRIDHPVCWPHGRRSGESEIHFIALNPSPGIKAAGLGFVLLTPCLPGGTFAPLQKTPPRSLCP